MATFILSTMQEEMIKDELIAAEKYRHNGVVFAQIAHTDTGSVVCIAHHVVQEKAERIKKILDE